MPACLEFLSVSIEAECWSEGKVKDFSSIVFLLVIGGLSAYSNGSVAAAKFIRPRGIVICVFRYNNREPIYFTSCL